MTDRAAEGWLALNIEPHDVLPDQPAAYYEALPDSLKHYQSIGRNDRDKNYFLQMYLADYRAIEYLASRPDWDGRTLVVTGTSMGGQQSLCAAGLNPRVTALVVNEPAGADSNGPLHGRASGYPNWPADDPQIMRTALYFDTVNCAMRIKVPSLVAMGFVDTIAPPAGIWTAFNQIQSRKLAVPMIDSAAQQSGDARATDAVHAPLRRVARADGSGLRPAAGRGMSRVPARIPTRSWATSSCSPRRMRVTSTSTSSATRSRAAGVRAIRSTASCSRTGSRTFSAGTRRDFGWGGDTTQNILWRLSHGELDGVNPKVIVVMAGTNNVGKAGPLERNGALAADVTNGVRAISTRAGRKRPAPGSC